MPNEPEKLQDATKLGLSLKVIAGLFLGLLVYALSELRENYKLRQQIHDSQLTSDIQSQFRVMLTETLKSINTRVTRLESNNLGEQWTIQHQIKYWQDARKGFQPDKFYLPDPRDVDDQIKHKSKIYNTQ